MTTTWKERLKEFIEDNRWSTRVDPSLIVTTELEAFISSERTLLLEQVREEVECLKVKLLEPAPEDPIWNRRDLMLINIGGRRYNQALSDVSDFLATLRY